MRTTLDLPEDLIKETMELTGAKTKTEAIKKAMEELIGRERGKELLKYKGSMPDLDIDLDTLRDRNWVEDLKKYEKSRR